MDGNGIYTWTNGNKYEGEFKNDLAEGYGVKDYYTISHYYNTKKNHFHTNVVITQNFFEY
jgi:hypothetical protein